MSPWCRATMALLSASYVAAGFLMMLADLDGPYVMLGAMAAVCLLLTTEVEP